MVHVSKKTVGQWLLISLLAEQRTLLEKDRLFALKYVGNFSAFEERLHQQTDEVFEQWDDYIEWKSIQTSLTEIHSKIEDVENGAIRVVE